MPSDLLRKALSMPTTRTTSLKTVEHDIDVAIAWAKGEITYSQVLSVISRGDAREGRSSVYSWLAQSLRDAVQQARLTEVPNGE